MGCGHQLYCAQRRPHRELSVFAFVGKCGGSGLTSFSWLWCKYLRWAGVRHWEKLGYAASTAFQIAGAAWSLRRRRRRKNWFLPIRRRSSMPAMVVAAES